MSGMLLNRRALSTSFKMLAACRLHKHAKNSWNYSFKLRDFKEQQYANSFSINEIGIYEVVAMVINKKNKNWNSLHWVLKSQRERLLGRSKHSWEDCIKMDFIIIVMIGDGWDSPLVLHPQQVYCTNPWWGLKCHYFNTYKNCSGLFQEPH
jgi:hypothetical protein